MNILLVEPKYNTKFPPLGLMRISAFHKERGDSVTFIRGTQRKIADVLWHRIYISTLFTYELSKTIKTIKYFQNSVVNPIEDIYVGGIGATLLPDMITSSVNCKVIEGPLDKSNMLGLGEKPISEYTPDYDILKTNERNYQPDDSYFARISTGCIRKCKFCAVPILEPKFSYLQSISSQIQDIKEKYGEKKNLIILDNNILALNNINDVIDDIVSVGFGKGAKLNQRKRYVDFNQGIDARLVTPEISEKLAKICVNPIRLAYDYDDIGSVYAKAVSLFAKNDFINFTTYVMYNYNDTPYSFYNRLKHNIDLSIKYKIRITSFPMRYIPITDTKRGYISPKWQWKYLRGIQCILNATHGLVSPSPNFFYISFGRTFEEFLEIVSMPDDYIIYRKKNENKANEWRFLFRKLSDTDKQEFLGYLYKKLYLKEINISSKYANLFLHYIK